MTRIRGFTRLAILISVVAVAVIGLAVVGSLRPSAQGRAPLPSADGPARVGIRYGQIPDSWGFKPRISAHRAIEIAKEVEGSSLLDPNAQITVKLVLFSDDAAYKENDQGERIFVFRDIPAWVVTFSNIKYPLPGGGSRRDAGPIDYLTQIHVAVDAISGKAIETYGWN